MPRRAVAVLALLVVLAATGRLEAQSSEAQSSEAQSSEAQSSEAQSSEAQSGLDASGWARVLERFATTDGGVRYEALRADPRGRAELSRFLDAVAQARPERWSRDARLAFYLDAYNALVVSAVVERWPVRSVMRVEGFFDRATHRVAGRDLTLNQLENDVIRRFEEPRIHFALSCASAGCPPLSRAPFSGAPLEPRLEALARAFVRASSRLDRARGRLVLSAIFEWYASDFGGPAGVRRFVALRLDPADAEWVRDRGVAVHHGAYDWAINAR